MYLVNSLIIALIVIDQMYRSPNQKMYFLKCKLYLKNLSYWSGIIKSIFQFAFLQRPHVPWHFWPASLSRCILAACTLLQACCHLCTSMFTNRPDKMTALRQTHNININKQTNPFTHRTPSKLSMHMQPDFIALTQPAVTSHCLPEAALFGSYPVHFSDLVSLLIDSVRESLASLPDNALA